MPAHVSGPGFIFWPFHVIRDYARQLAASRHAAALPGYLALAAELEAAQMPLPIVFGHHDLLPANILDDGARLWLIDFEYAGFGTADVRPRRRRRQCRHGPGARRTAC